MNWEGERRSLTFCWLLYWSSLYCFACCFYSLGFYLFQTLEEFFTLPFWMFLGQSLVHLSAKNKDKLTGTERTRSRFGYGVNELKLSDGSQSAGLASHPSWATLRAAVCNLHWFCCYVGLLETVWTGCCWIENWCVVLVCRLRWCMDFSIWLVSGVCAVLDIVKLWAAFVAVHIVSFVWIFAVIVFSSVQNEC